MRASMKAASTGRVACLAAMFGLVTLLPACSGAGRDITPILMGPAVEEEVDMVGRRPEPPGGPRCPGITVREGTEALRVYERGREGDPRHLRFQGTVSNMARECIFIDDRTVRIKVGVAGRVITGPAGGPGNYQLPLRVAFVRSGGQVVSSQLYRVPVSVPSGEANVQFNHVSEDISFQLPAGDGFGLYVVLVGFDEMS